MRALRFDGQAVRLVTDAPQPVPGPGEALIRPTLVGICSTDLEMSRAGATFRGTLGHEFVGVVEYVNLPDNPAAAMVDRAKRLKDNGVRFFNGSAGVVQALIRGDIVVAAVIEPPGINAISDGAPVRISYPASVVPAVGTPCFVPAKCPHPEAGMVFLNWAMSGAGQASLQDKMGSPVTRPGMGDPKLVPGTAAQKIVLSSELLTPAKQKAMIDEWRQVFGLQ